MVTTALTAPCARMLGKEGVIRDIEGKRGPGGEKVVGGVGKVGKRSSPENKHRLHLQGANEKTSR